MLLMVKSSMGLFFNRSWARVNQNQSMYRVAYHMIGC